MRQWKQIRMLRAFFVKRPPCAILDVSNPAPQKHYLAYRHRVNPSASKKDIVAEYQDVYLKTKHIGKKVKFTISGKPNQSPTRFFRRR